MISAEYFRENHSSSNPLPLSSPTMGKSVGKPRPPAAYPLEGSDTDGCKFLCNNAGKAMGGHSFTPIAEAIEEQMRDAASITASSAKCA